MEDTRQFKTGFDHEAVVAKKIFMQICADNNGEIYISRLSLLEWLTLDDATLGPKGATARLSQLLKEIRLEHEAAQRRDNKTLANK